MEAFVTLATSDGYAVGALVLAHSLRAHNTSKQLCIMVTPGVTMGVRTTLEGVFDLVVLVDVLDSKDTAHLSLLQRPELGVTFSKLHCWTLTNYSKCVFLDADTLALKNIDDLFLQPQLSAACDIGWPDCFNSGMFVFVPSTDTYDSLLKFAQDQGSFDGGDQGLLNMYFPDWNRVSFAYNMVASATYTYMPAFRQFGKDVKLVHFLGAVKPWHGQSSEHHNTAYEGYMHTWWTLYRHAVESKLPKECTSSTHQAPQTPPFHPSPSYPSSHHGFVPHEAATTELSKGIPRSQVSSPEINNPELSAQLASAHLSEDLNESRRRWEDGQPEYLGRDSMDNILAFIDTKVTDKEE